MRLQQSFTLCPFMQEFVSFTAIAGRTGNNQIRRIIAPSTAQWDNMVNIILSIQALIAIIASSFLSFILHLYILRCVLAYSVSFSGNAIPIASTHSLPIILTVDPSPFNSYLWIQFMIVFTASLAPTLSIPGIFLCLICWMSLMPTSYPRFHPLRISMTIVPINLITSASILLIAASSFAKALISFILIRFSHSSFFCADKFRIFFAKLSTCTVATIFTCPLCTCSIACFIGWHGKHSNRLYNVANLAFPLYLRWFRGLSSFCFAAFFARSAETISSIFLRVEVFCCFRFQLFAPITLFQWYNSIHGKANSLSSRPGLFAVAPGHQYFTYQLYHKTASQASLWYFLLPCMRMSVQRHAIDRKASEMTRYFIDTEFIDDGKTIGLISIGIVCEDGREYYAQDCTCDLTRAPQWVQDHVIPHLGKQWKSRRQICDDIQTFMDIENYGKPEIWGWCAAYDWVALCQLFGTMMDLPDEWPHYICDIQYLLDKHNIADSALPLLTGSAHNALDDALQIEAIYEFLEHHEKSALEQLAKREKERESARHSGRLYIDPFCGPEGLEIPIYGTIYDNIAMINTAIDTWKNHLRLPEHYAITGVFFDVVRGQWVLLIESNQFPEVPRDEYPPLLSITHQRLDDGSIKFLELKVVEKG